ncbi:RING-H2 finger protein ATL72-like [Punica granatum]|uniref:RING-type E3 ubiquitin transferase n=2 Tax=Punica granatum TaxID=22663 RepID=A0A218WBU5_PUNGR|nr:RING-H2 finger protein ATL72-like [Punica granatum]OWM69671.1 hypothetical protein CDL15_Pgr025520 [Punica granatum]PKI57642.1 hypothetical protein CRG98_021970 [Punica granatum]
MEGPTGSLPPPQDPGKFFTPLLISLACMIGTCLVIVAYHLIVVKYCLSRTRQRLIADEILARHNLPAAASANNCSSLGVEEKVLKTIPVITYSSGKGNPHFRVDQRECAVCLGELEDGEAVRLLPSCRHAFHVTCIDQWFLAHSSCPMCRLPVVGPAVDQDQVELEKPLPAPCSSNVHSTSPERLLSARLLRHSVSFVMPPGEKLGLPPCRTAGLKRSFSMMDPSHLVIDIERDQVKATSSSSSSSSSSSQEALLRSTSDSTRRFDQLSSRLLRSFSQLRIGRTGSGSSATTALPN